MKGISCANIDGLVKSRKTPLSVIPAKAGIQFIQLVTKALDSGFHRSDDFLRVDQYFTPRNPYQDPPHPKVIFHARPKIGSCVAYQQSVGVNEKCLATHQVKSWDE